MKDAKGHGSNSRGGKSLMEHMKAFAKDQSGVGKEVPGASHLHHLLNEPEGVYHLGHVAQHLQEFGHVLGA